MKRIWRALAVVGAGALVVGVAVAIAGVPHLTQATGDVTTGTTCTKRCTTSPTGGAATLSKASDDAAVAAAGAGTQIIPATVTIRWSGQQMSKTDNLVGTLQGTAKWACFNGGSNIPAEQNNQKAAQAVNFVAQSDVKHPSKSGNTSGELTILNPGIELTTLACQGTQVIALYSLKLASAPAPGTTFTFQVTASADQGSSVIEVVPGTVLDPANPEWLYCRDGNFAACFS